MKRLKRFCQREFIFIPNVEQSGSHRVGSLKVLTNLKENKGQVSTSFVLIKIIEIIIKSVIK